MNRTWPYALTAALLYPASQFTVADAAADRAVARELYRESIAYRTAIHA